jgi:hypothetical protein
MMRGGTLLLTAPLLFCALPAIAQEPAAPIAQCIRENAPKVEHTVASLLDATSFLVDEVCATETASEIQHQREIKYKEAQEREKQKRACQTKAGSDTNALAACNTQNAETTFTSVSQFFPTGVLPASKLLPEVTSYAAKELLRLRLSQAKPGN